MSFVHRYGSDVDGTGKRDRAFAELKEAPRPHTRLQAKIKRSTLSAAEAAASKAAGFRSVATIEAVAALVVRSFAYDAHALATASPTLHTDEAVEAAVMNMQMEGGITRFAAVCARATPDRVARLLLNRDIYVGAYNQCALACAVRSAANGTLRIASTPKSTMGDNRGARRCAMCAGKWDRGLDIDIDVFIAMQGASLQP